MREYFENITRELFKNIKSNELLIINFDAEESKFVRLNKGKIRQAGSVKQISMTLSLSTKDKRNLKSYVRLNGSFERDISTLIKTLNYLRRELPDLPKDPYMMFSTSVHSTEITSEKQSTSDEVILEHILNSATKLDLVGIFSSGSIYTGLANSLGQKNWHEDYSFSFDYSIYNKNNNAIKLNYSSKKWNKDDYDFILNKGIEKLAILSNTEKKITTGEYRVYLEPSALNEIIDDFYNTKVANEIKNKRSETKFIFSKCRPRNGDIQSAYDLDKPSFWVPEKRLKRNWNLFLDDLDKAAAKHLVKLGVEKNWKDVLRRMRNRRKKIEKKTNN